jgi:3-oxoacid CoA-transferase subunit B
MIARAAKEIKPGTVVNLGIGLPTRVIGHLPADIPVCLHSENGITGIGPALPFEAADRSLIDAGGAYISPVPGTAYFDSAVSFALVRSGRLDLTMLGAFQVSMNGDLANWKIPGLFTPGAGGGMELAQKARQVIVLTTHQDRKGRSKLVQECTLPLTARGCVDRIFTDMAVIDVTANGFHLREIVEGLSVDEVLAATAAPMTVPLGEIPVF